MVIITQNCQCLFETSILSKIYIAGEDGKATLRAEFRDGKGERLANYQTKDQCQFALETLAVAMSAQDLMFRFPSAAELQEKMSYARQHGSKVTSMKVGHGGS